MQTITFYSYKGGVGRTLMVAHMARYLASFGQKVFAVDFDLEAPGLHYKLEVESPKRGLVDLLCQIFDAGEIPESLEPYVVAVEEKNDAGGSIHLLPAGAAPSPAYWRQLARLDWHDLFYSEEASGVPLFLELQERIAQDYAPDFLLIDSRTGITEVGGATTTLLADRVICLLLNNRENLDGAKEVLRSLRRAPRLPGQAPLEIWPVLSRIPEIGGEREVGLVREVRDFLCAEADDLVSTLTFPELFVLHTDSDLQIRETLFIGGGKRTEKSPLLRDYLALFGKLVSVEALVGPTVRAIAERWETDHFGAERDFAKLAELAPRPVIQPLLNAELARQLRVKARRVAEELQVEAATTTAEVRSLLRVLGFPQPSPDLTRAAETYLGYLVDRHRYLDFSGMGASDLRLPLLDMYVSLKARLLVLEPRELGPRLLGPLPLLDLLRDQSGLILLGDPGAGKTTFLKYLALALATGQGEALGLGTRLPVLVSLTTYVKALTVREISLEDFLAHYHVETWISLSLEGLLARGLEQGSVLLLLDGLDEVHQPEQRKYVIEQVEKLYSRHRRAGNKLVMTSRILGYREVQPKAEGLAEATLVDFGTEEIESFVGKLTTFLDRAADDSALAFLAAAREREELLAAIQANSGVRELAANPLLLTVLAFMKRQRGALPVRRVALYQTCVEILLSTWNISRSFSGRSRRDLDAAETIEVLAPLALAMHQMSPAAGLLTEGDLQRELEQIYRERGHSSPEKAARLFQQAVREQPGLLIARGEKVYGFIHLAFQEYLAAVAVVQRAKTGTDEVVRLIAEHIGEPRWREVSLLAVGYLGVVQQRDQAASEVVEKLLQISSPPGLAAVLAGEALAEMGVDRVTARCRTEAIMALISTTLDQKVPPSVSSEAGRVLSQLGVKAATDVWV